MAAAKTRDEIAARAAQIHGCYGFIKDYKAERIYRDCLVLSFMRAPPKCGK